MKKAGELFFLALAVCALLTVCAYASAPQITDVKEFAAPDSFAVTFIVNGMEVIKADVGAVETNGVYTFEAAELFEAIGLDLTYDEATNTAVLEPAPGSISSVLLEPMITEAERASNGVRSAKTSDSKLTAAPVKNEAAARPDLRSPEKIRPVNADTAKPLRQDRAKMGKAMRTDLAAYPDLRSRDKVRSEAVAVSKPLMVQYGKAEKVQKTELRAYPDLRCREKSVSLSAAAPASRTGYDKLTGPVLSIPAKDR